MAHQLKVWFGDDSIENTAEVDLCSVEQARNSTKSQYRINRLFTKCEITKPKEGLSPIRLV